MQAIKIYRDSISVFGDTVKWSSKNKASFMCRYVQFLQAQSLITTFVKLCENANYVIYREFQIYKIFIWLLPCVP